MKGFTLIELLVVLLIITLLIGLLLPVIQSSREAARSAECKSNLHQIGVALHQYESAHKHLPEYYIIDADLAKLKCPTDSQKNDYIQGWRPGVEMTLVRYIEEDWDGRPSNEIWFVWDTMWWHDKVKNMLFLDGHVEGVNE